MAVSNETKDAGKKHLIYNAINCSLVPEEMRVWKDTIFFARSTRYKFQVSQRTINKLKGTLVRREM